MSTWQLIWDRRRIVLALLLFCNCGAPPQLDPSAILLEETSETSANVSAGDLDGDGDLDLILAKGRHWPLQNMVLLNDGAAGFGQRHPLDEEADRTYTTAVADLDGDADLDVVVGNDRPDSKRIYLNDGAASFQLSSTFGDADWPTRNVTVADLNGDDRPDVIVANRGGPERSSNAVCINDGSGRFPECQLLSGESATTIAAGDLNGDGTIDLVVPHRDGGQSQIFLNDGAARFSEPIPWGEPVSSTRAIALGDLNGDGRPDIVAGDEVNGGARIYYNQGEDLFHDSHPVGERDDETYSIAIADLDGDGANDVVLGNRATRSVILFNRGENQFEARRFGDDAGAVYGLALGDLNGDGVVDIAAARSDLPNVLYLGSPGDS